MRGLRTAGRRKGEASCAAVRAARVGGTTECAERSAGEVSVGGREARRHKDTSSFEIDVSVRSPRPSAARGRCPAQAHHWRHLRSRRQPFRAHDRSPPRRRARRARRCSTRPRRSAGERRAATSSRVPRATARSTLITGRPPDPRFDATTSTDSSPTRSRAPRANREGSSLASSTTNDPSSPCGRPTLPTTTRALTRRTPRSPRRARLQCGGSGRRTPAPPATRSRRPPPPRPRRRTASS